MRRALAIKVCIFTVSVFLFFSCRNSDSSDVTFAGVVSHHLLVADYIDEWFSILASKNPNIDTFIILSPSHWKLSTRDFSLTFKDFEGDNGEKVETDIKTEKKLLEKSGGKIEDEVYYYEHGVSSLIPFIAMHFPKAKVAAIACDSGVGLKRDMGIRLSETIAPFVGKEKYFILISSDFSHFKTPEETLRIDAVSRVFFENPSFKTFPLVMCDNRVSFFALSKNFPENTKSEILRNTNSFLETGQGIDEITSYFFAYFTFPRNKL